MNYVLNSKPLIASPFHSNSLASYVKLELLLKETPERIKEIWLEFHKNKSSTISAVIPITTYDKLMSRVKQNPIFVFPIPKEKGFLTIYFEAKGEVFIFTPLELYHKLGANASPCLTVYNYPDLRAVKEIILMRGEISSKLLNTIEAASLLNVLQIYYLDDSKFKYVETFNHNPSGFNFNDIINDASNAFIDSDTKTSIK